MGSRQGNVTSWAEPSLPSHLSSNSLSSGELAAAITVPVGTILLTLIGLFIFWRQRWLKQRHNSAKMEIFEGKIEDMLVPATQSHGTAELDTSGRTKVELPAALPKVLLREHKTQTSVALAELSPTGDGNVGSKELGTVSNLESATEAVGDRKRSDKSVARQEHKSSHNTAELE